MKLTSANVVTGLLGLLVVVALVALGLDIFVAPGRPGDLGVLIIMAVGCVLAAVLGRTAQQRLETNAARAEAALAQSEARKQALEQQASQLAQQNEEQGRLLELVTTLEVPMVTLADGVVLAPIVGTLDSRRATALITRLLQSVSEQRARLVVLDIAGVSSVDTAVAQALIESTRAVRLLGCDVTISGISAAVAITLTHLSIDLNGIATARSPQEALKQFSEQTQVAPGARGAQLYGLN